MIDIPKNFRDSNYNIVPYDGSPVQWRISIYGLVIQDDALLLVHHKNEKFYDIPGGGVEMDENLEEALLREGQEEAGWKLIPKQFIYAQSDWFYHAEEKQFYKTMQLYFTATGEKVSAPTDERMIFSELVPIKELKNYELYPNIHTALDHLGIDR